MPSSTKNTRIVHAPKDKTYEAFVTPSALEIWLAPDAMKGKIHDFDLKVGGGYTMSLFYDDKEFKGKTDGNEDKYTTTFTEIKPHEKIVQTIQFQSDQKEFAGEMIMDVSLKEIERDSTEVTIVFRNIPDGIKPEDNEAGTEQSLDKLTRYLYENK